MLYIENLNEYKFDFDYEALANEVTSYVLSKEGCKYKAEINLYLVDDDEIKEINSSQRNIDRKTDVLSFPNIDYETPSDMSHIEEGDPMYFDPENSNLILGDIIISVPTLRAQAAEYGHSEKREFAFLITHSMLHLLGYDHMVKEEEKIMFDKQNIYLEEMGITR